MGEKTRHGAVRQEPPAVEASTPTAWPISSTSPSRFELAPPRHFLLPAIILLLSEEPSHGYRLVKALPEFRFGRVDRPSVYRALAQLERDGLVTSWPEAAKAGQPRRVYGLTDHGERVLRAWMGVIKEERDGLDRVLRRYLATRSGDAVLAEVEGNWAASLGQAWSAVSPTASATSPHRYPRAGERPRPGGGAEVHGFPAPRLDAGAALDVEEASDLETSPKRFRLNAERSVVLIEARSTVGPISFGAIGVTGFVEALLRGDAICAGGAAAHLEVEVDRLHSGNDLYDAELLRRIHARRFPTVSVDLSESTEVGGESRFRLTGDITFHGVTRTVEGTVNVSMASPRKLIATGEQVLDIRDFDVESPTVLMLRIYPDVRVHLHVEAELES